jgi:hypothetical protein
MVAFNYLPRTVPTTALLIDLPFNISNLGRVATLPETDHKVYQNQVISVMGTNTGERIWYERYTAGIGDTLFENSDDAAGLIKKSIGEAFVRWLPHLSFIKADVGYDSTTGILSITIVYRTPTGLEDSVKIITSSLTPSGETTVVAYGR